MGSALRLICISSGQSVGSFGIVMVVPVLISNIQQWLLHILKTGTSGTRLQCLSITTDVVCKLIYLIHFANGYAFINARIQIDTRIHLSDWLYMRLTTIIIKYWNTILRCLIAFWHIWIVMSFLKASTTMNQMDHSLLNSFFTFEVMPWICQCKTACKTVAFQNTPGSGSFSTPYGLNWNSMCLPEIMCAIWSIWSSATILR